MSSLIEDINTRIEKVFSKRLSESLAIWIEEFSNFRNSKKLLAKNKYITFSVIHEVLVKGSKIIIEPPI